MREHKLEAAISLMEQAMASLIAAGEEYSPAACRLQLAIDLAKGWTPPALEGGQDLIDALMEADGA